MRACIWGRARKAIASECTRIAAKDGDEMREAHPRSSCEHATNSRSTRVVVADGAHFAARAIGQSQRCAKAAPFLHSFSNLGKCVNHPAASNRESPPSPEKNTKYLHPRLLHFFSCDLSVSSSAALSPICNSQSLVKPTLSRLNLCKMAAVAQDTVYPKSHVGFDSITQQIEKKLLKRGFQFNVICVGKSFIHRCGEF
jgi:hypothetical protein